MKAIIQYYQHLNSKEQKILNIGLLAITFFLIYQFVYSPFQEKISLLTKQQIFQQELNTWFKQIAPKLKQYTEGSTIGSRMSASDLLTHSLANVKQTFDPIAYKLSQSQAGGIELKIKYISYQQFIHWFETFFEANRGLNIQELSITPNTQPGMVTVSLRYESI